MKEDVHDLDRLKQAFQSAENTLPTEEPCPTAEDLWDAQKGKLDHPRTHAIVDHTSRCGMCAQAWRLAQAVYPPASAETKAGTRGKVIRFRWVTPAAAMAAAAVLVIAFAIQYQKQNQPIPSEVTYRDSLTDQDIQSTLPHLAALPRHAFTLEWKHSIPQTVTFDVQVKTEMLDAVASAIRLEEGRYTIPEANLTQLPSGTRLFWQVMARIDGEPMRWSPTFVNVIE